MRIVTRLISTAVALAVAAWAISGIRFSGPSQGMAQVEEKLLPLVLVAMILGLLTSFVKPVLQILSIPFIIVTLGLFLLVINALLLMFTGWFADRLGIGFEVTGFWPAVGGSIIITIVTWIVDAQIGPEDRP